MSDANKCNHCTSCMCFNCRRLDIPPNTKGHCDACKHCKATKPFVDLRQSEFCAWKKDFEKLNKII